ncbi:uncharacterized protein SCHCODRAFT_02625289, partial [Schizophyllum commune H4-8]|uniref:uncharacterized protein n=1 Tax=Schizophyllum commune (strain H4-8 / FGSC 9210) TaxID=578458 RepID=UPI00215E784D
MAPRARPQGAIPRTSQGPGPPSGHTRPGPTTFVEHRRLHDLLDVSFGLGLCWPSRGARPLDLEERVKR